MILCDTYDTDGCYRPGEQRPVTDTAFDLRAEVTLGDALDRVGKGGYDHCFVIHDLDRGKLRLGASFAHPPSG